MRILIALFACSFLVGCYSDSLAEEEESLKTTMEISPVSLADEDLVVTEFPEEESEGSFEEP